MNNRETPFPSLLRHFDAPDGFKGHFGWIVGFSADSLFINAAAERFTTHTRSQRTHMGQISLALFLDPSNPALTLEDAHWRGWSLRNRFIKAIRRHAKRSR